MKKIRNFATWAVMSAFALITLDARLNFLPTSIGLMLMAIMMAGVWVAMGAQVSIWTSRLLRLMGFTETWKEWTREATRAEVERYRPPL